MKYAFFYPIKLPNQDPSSSFSLQWALGSNRLSLGAVTDSSSEKTDQPHGHLRSPLDVLAEGPLNLDSSTKVESTGQKDAHVSKSAVESLDGTSKRQKVSHLKAPSPETSPTLSAPAPAFNVAALEDTAPLVALSGDEAPQQAAKERPGRAASRRGESESDYLYYSDSESDLEYEVVDVDDDTPAERPRRRGDRSETTKAECVAPVPASPSDGELDLILAYPTAQISLQQFDYFVAVDRLSDENKLKLAYAYAIYAEDKLSRELGAGGQGGDLHDLRNQVVKKLLDNDISTTCTRESARLAMDSWRLEHRQENYHHINVDLFKICSIFPNEFPAITALYAKGLMVQHPCCKAGIKSQNETRHGSVVTADYLKKTTAEFQIEIENPNSLNKGQVLFVDDPFPDLPAGFIQVLGGKAEELGCVSTWGTTQNISNESVQRLKAEHKPIEDGLDYVKDRLTESIGLKKGEFDCQEQFRFYSGKKCLDDVVESGGVEEMQQPTIHQDGFVAIRMIVHLAMEQGAVMELGVEFQDVDGKLVRGRINFAEEKKVFVGTTAFFSEPKNQKGAFRSESGNKIYHGVAGNKARASYVLTIFEVPEKYVLALDANYTASLYTGASLDTTYYGLRLRDFVSNYTMVVTGQPTKRKARGGSRPIVSHWKCPISVDSTTGTTVPAAKPRVECSQCEGTTVKCWHDGPFGFSTLCESCYGQYYQYLKRTPVLPEALCHALECHAKARASKEKVTAADKAARRDATAKAARDAAAKALEEQAAVVGAVYDQQRAMICGLHEPMAARLMAIKTALRNRQQPDFPFAEMFKQQQLLLLMIDQLIINLNQQRPVGILSDLRNVHVGFLQWAAKHQVEIMKATLQLASSLQQQPQQQPRNIWTDERNQLFLKCIIQLDARGAKVTGSTILQEMGEGAGGLNMAQVQKKLQTYRTKLKKDA